MSGAMSLLAMSALMCSHGTMWFAIAFASSATASLSTNTYIPYIYILVELRGAKRRRLYAEDPMKGRDILYG